MRAQKVRAAALAVLGTTAFAAPARAGWSAPELVDAGHYATDPWRTIDARGDAALLWEDLGDTTGGRYLAARSRDAGAWSPRRRLDRPGPEVDSTPLVGNARGDQVALVKYGSVERPRGAIDAFLRAPEGEFGPRLVLPVAEDMTYDLGRDGRFIVLGTTDGQVSISERRPGEPSFANPRRFRGGGSSSRVVNFGRAAERVVQFGHGGVLAVWNDYREYVGGRPISETPYYALRTSAKAPWRTGRVGTARHTSTPAIAANSRGDVVLAWTSRRVYLNGDYGPATLHVRGRPAGAKGFGRERILQQNRWDAQGPRVSIDRRGRTTVVWQRISERPLPDNRHRPSAIMTARGSTTTGHWKTRRLSPRGQAAHAPRMAANAGGEVAVAWRFATRGRGLDDATAVTSARRRRGFLRPTQLAHSTAGGALFAQLRVDPRGDVVATWSDTGAELLRGAVWPAGSRQSGNEVIGKADGDPIEGYWLTMAPDGTAATAFGDFPPGSHRVAVRRPGGGWSERHAVDALPVIAVAPGRVLAAWQPPSQEDETPSTTLLASRYFAP